MKTLIAILIASAMISSCNGQSSKAIKDQQDAYKVLDDAEKKATNATSEGGWTMTCLIDGQSWKASGIMTPSQTGRIVGKYKDGKISLPLPPYEVGHKTNFENSAVDFSPVGAPDFWGGHSGEMEVTRVQGGWAEGKFHFTAKLMKSDKKIEVTDGFYRIKIK